MWLPTQIYERVPQTWFLMGLLFVANGLYLGVDLIISQVCLVAGIVCCAIGAGVAAIRMRSRRTESDSSAQLASIK